MLFGLFRPEAKGTLNCHFFFNTWGYLRMLRISGRGENRSRNCHCFCPENFFLSPSFFAKRKLPQTWCPSGSECMSLPAAAPVLCTPNMGKPSQRSLGEKNPPLD